MPRLSVVVLAVVASLPPSGPVLAADISFDTPVVQATLGRPFRVSIGFRSSLQPIRVELLTRLPGNDSWFVREAELSGGSGRYAAVVEDEDHVLPNTRFLYRFRVTVQGERRLTPEATLTFADERFSWQVLEGRLVRLHWYEGSREFAQRALSIGEKAVADVSTLLGVTESERIDFFVYASQSAFREALGPGTRENVGGQANASIRTLFALIEPSQINSDWVDVVIPHELTHLVFDTAVHNPYREPPHWLDEGIAVFLSEGYGAGDRSRVAGAGRSGDLIPLDGLSGQFPATREKFFLAYAESVSAVDFFIRKYGRDTLVKLVRSYGQGLTDDEAFTAATGADVKAFSSAWLADVGAGVPAAYGPRQG
ncbi:MAG: peptidase MA family metallohydrolase, partial [Chloroflexota bacterium]|nr:peptidase MA family metallohydrolase [Chloroflexota bacterium]